MFEFRLQPVLNFRKRREEEKQKELAEAGMERQKIGSELLALSADMDEKSAELGALFARPTDAATPRLYSDYLRRREDEVGRKKAELEGSEENMRKKQAELGECVKRRRTLEVLRERRLAAHVREERRKERILMDEIATNIWFKEAR